MWTVCKYFDDHFERIVSEHKTKEEAEEARDKLKPGTYVSYEVRKKEVQPSFVQRGGLYDVTE